jgi:hypothetical protein
MFENVYDEKDPSGRGCNEVCEQNVWAAGPGRRHQWPYMAMPCKKDALCSPTSALEKKQMLNRLGEELRNLF